MVNPAGPLGRVTGRSAAKLHGGDSNDSGEAVQHSRSGKSRELGQHLQRPEKNSRPPSGSSKPLRIEKTRDYHRFLHPGNRSIDQKPIQRQTAARHGPNRRASRSPKKARRAGFERSGPAPSIGSARRRNQPAEKQIGCNAKSCRKSVKIELTCAAFPRNFSDFLPALLSS